MTTRSTDLNYVESNSGINSYKATSDTYYKGSLVALKPSTGLAILWTGVAEYQFLGVVSGQQVSTAAITDMVKVDERGVILKRITVTGASAVTDTGSLVWAADDDPETVTLTPTPLAGAVGRIVRWWSSTTCDVRLFTPEEYTSRITYGNWTFSLPLDTLADGDIITTFTPGFAGRLIKTYAFANVVETTGSKASTLNWEIGTTDVTGGVIVLESAGLNALGEVEVGTAITAANHFTATDTISLEASSTTTFIEGAIDVILTFATD